MARKTIRPKQPESLRLVHCAELNARTVRKKKKQGRFMGKLALLVQVLRIAEVRIGWYPTFPVLSILVAPKQKSW